MATERAAIIGASSFGREALDAVEAMAAAGAAVEVAGVIDDGSSKINLERLEAGGVAYLGTLESWLAGGKPAERYVLGTGEPGVRRRLVERLEAAGASPFTAVHTSATFGALVEVGEGVVVWAGATISTNVHLRRHLLWNPNATIGHDAVLLDLVFVNPAAVISGDVAIGEATLVGAAATILEGWQLGRRRSSGGAVVTKEILQDVVVVGVLGTLGWWQMHVSRVGAPAPHPRIAGGIIVWACARATEGERHMDPAHTWVSRTKMCQDGRGAIAHARWLGYKRVRANSSSRGAG